MPMESKLRALRARPVLVPFRLSAQLLAVTPTAHFLEYVDWAAPILELPARVVDGYVAPSTSPGSGIAWNEEAVARYAVR